MKLLESRALRTDEALAERVGTVAPDPFDLLVLDLDLETAGGFAERTGAEGSAGGHTTTLLRLSNRCSKGPALSSPPNRVCRVIEARSVPPGSPQPLAVRERMIRIGFDSFDIDLWGAAGRRHHKVLAGATDLGGRMVVVERDQQAILERHRFTHEPVGHERLGEVVGVATTADSRGGQGIVTRAPLPDDLMDSGAGRQCRQPEHQRCPHCQDEESPHSYLLPRAGKLARKAPYAGTAEVVLGVIVGSERRNMANQITYATMSADNEELHAAYEPGIEIARGWLGQDHPFYVNGRPRHGEGWYEEYSPIDQQLLIGRYSQATVADMNDAVAAALEYQPTSAVTPWRERVAIIRPLGDVLDEQTPELATLLPF